MPRLLTPGDFVRWGARLDQDTAQLRDWLAKCPDRMILAANWVQLLANYHGGLTKLSPSWFADQDMASRLVLTRFMRLGIETGLRSAIQSQRIVP